MRASSVILPLCVLMAVAGCDEERADPRFKGKAGLAFRETPPLAPAPHVKPALFAPKSGGGEGFSYYVGGIGRLTEITLPTGDVRLHPIPFDRTSDAIYGAGTAEGWLGPDGNIYFGMHGRPGRIARFVTETAEMQLLGEVETHAVMRCFFGPNRKAYFINYPATLTELDMETGKLRSYGRLTPSALYVHGDAWIGADGNFYCSPGQRPPQPLKVNLETGDITFLEKLPEKTLHPNLPSFPFPNFNALYKVSTEEGADWTNVVLETLGESKGMTIRVKFQPTTVLRDIHTIGAGPDGKIYACGSYYNTAFDPVSMTVDRLGFVYNIYDYASSSQTLFFGGYPNARLGVLRTDRPINSSKPGERKPIWNMTSPDENPRELINFFHIDDTDASNGTKLQMKRLWSIHPAANGTIYCACSASRQNRGGALVAVQPETAKYEVFRQPQLRFLGARAICAIEGTPRIAVATFVSPDATAPGQEPDSAKLLFFDTETNSFVDEAVPLPGCKVIAGIIQIPGTRKLVGIGLHDAVPDADSDDSFTGPGTVFVYDLDAAKTGLQEVFPYPICGREGRPLTVAPDGSVWFSGGGGIFRVEPCGTAIEALAACGARGNMVFLNGSVFMDGGKGIRWADIRNLISKEK